VAARDDDLAAYSVLEIDAVAGGNEPPCIRTVVGLMGFISEPGLSFVVAHSKHGSWIVGVSGGLRAGTIIFDPRTLKTFRGPRLAYPKREPALISHGSEIYSISRRPLVVPQIVAEPPKLLGPHAPVLVSKTSDIYACAPDNLTGSVRLPKDIG
jgi:hypothetical protein